MRLFFRLSRRRVRGLSFSVGRARAPVFFPARSGDAHAAIITVYSSLDEPLAMPMIEGFQAANPDVAVNYEDMLTGAIYDRIVKETDAGGRTADFALFLGHGPAGQAPMTAMRSAPTCRSATAGRPGPTGATLPMR